MLKKSIAKIVFFFGVMLMVLNPVFDNPISNVQTAMAGNETEDYDIKVKLDGNGSVSSSDPSRKRKAVNKLFKKGKFFVVALTGLAALFMVIVFIYHLIKLGATAGNPQERKQCLLAILLSGLATAGLGSVTLIVALFYNMLV